MPKKIKGKISEYEREVMQRNLPMVEDDDAYENYRGRVSEREREYLGEQMPSMPSTGGMGLEDESLKPGQEYRMKKGGMTKGQKKVGKVMSEFKSGKLKSSSGKKVTNPKQAIAIGLSEAGMSDKKMGGGMMNDNSSQYSHGGMNKKKMQNGGMVRGQGAAIRGTKFKGIF